MDSIIFSRSGTCPELYLVDCDGRQVAFLLPRGTRDIASTLDLTASWNIRPAGCYFFLPIAIAEAQHAAFALAAWSYLSASARRAVRFVWLENLGAAQGLRGQSIALYETGGAWRTDRLTRFDFGGIAVLVGKKCVVEPASTGDAFRITPDTANSCALQTPSGRRYPIDGDLLLPLCGAASGCVRFELTLKPSALTTELPDLDIGLRIFVQDISFPESEGSFFVTSLRYPVLSENSTDWEGFGDLKLYATLDPLGHLEGDRTYFSFVSPAGDAEPSALPSYYRTNLGYTIDLTPYDQRSRLVFAPRPAASQPGGDNRYYLVPAGEFAMTVRRDAPAASPDPRDYDDNLLCGLSGVEYIKLDPGRTNLLCFHPGGAAFAPGFTLGAQAANNDHRLTDLATTSWAYVRQTDAGTPIYYAQPDQAVLYQPDATTGAATNLLNYMEVPAAALPDPGDQPPTFPLFPYGGVQAAPACGIGLADYQELELQRLNPTRRAAIHAIRMSATNATQRSSPHATLEAIDDVSGTTPQGLLASFSADFATIRNLTLAKDTDGALLTFEDIQSDSPLRTALQSNQLFLVISDPEALKAYFSTNNQLTIQGWTFDLDPASWQKQGMLLIFKFHEKPMTELIEDTQVWALPKAFNKNPGATRRRLVGLVQDAIAKGADDAPPKDREHYEQLARAAIKPGWSGIIALNVNLSPSDMPEELLALSAGINKDTFYAKYVGIETTPITPLDGRLDVGQSSLFGLIDYRDDSAPLPNDTGYNFQVARLQVLFQNSQVKAFSSDVIVTLDRLFGERTQLLDSSTGRNIVVFKGSAENHDGRTTYAFSFSGENHFTLPESQVLNEVEIIKAQFSTDPVARPIGDTTAVVGRFSFWGRLNFRRLERFDVFSFGAEDSSGASAGGVENDKFLSFANLLVTMRFQLSKPTERVFAFDPRGMAFDLRRSRVRGQSLYAKFPLKFAGLLYSAGDGDKPLDDYGYMPVRTPLGGARIAGPWYGLTFDLELGSLGALAGGAGLVASVIAAWSPGKPGVYVGLRLPGSSGGKREIAVQGVLKIVFKSLEFVAGELGGQASYLLKLKNIQIKFLILSFPPNGQTEIIIFGDPNGQAENNTVGWYAAYAKDPTSQPRLPGA